jgi:endogenous inhibitor of DNA gyrase (YacG/DUF329 family)
MKTPNVKCLGCGKECYMPKNRLDTFKYCSRTCKNKFGNITKIIATCGICNKEFSHISSRANNAKYCSRRCYYDSQKMKGKKEYKCHHCEKVFIGHAAHKRKFCSKECVGKNTRSIWQPKFTTVRKKMLREGLMNECEKCGYNEIPQILGVHHIDENRENNNRNNLMVVCPMCHSILHMKHISH